MKLIAPTLQTASIIDASHQLINHIRKAGLTNIKPIYESEDKLIIVARSKQLPFVLPPQLIIKLMKIARTRKVEFQSFSFELKTITFTFIKARSK